MQKKKNNNLLINLKLKTKKLKEINKFLITFLGKTGIFFILFENFRKLLFYKKKKIGLKINKLKNKVKKLTNFLKKGKKNIPQKDLLEDFTKPGIHYIIGRKHPISIVKHTIINIFEEIGFLTVEGPEIEDDWHNFTALNFPYHHPAREMQDTFFIQKNPDFMLRTHTSCVQIRYMETNSPPLRVLSPGRVYRNESISMRSHCMFNQIEGLYIDKDVSFTCLKQTIQYFIHELFGNVHIRFRPSYFPFTEPSLEIDIYCGLKSEKDRSFTKGTGWLEVMGCGMVDPNVLQNVNINPKKFSGFAFGLGVERISLLLYNNKNIRFFYENNI